IAVDGEGNAYVTGQTQSLDFPTVNPFQAAYGGGNFDAFVTKIPQPSAAVNLAPPQLDCGNEPVGDTSASQVSTLTNRGELTLTITSIQLTGSNSSDFAASNNCGNSLAAGGSCQISVTFTPSANGTRTAAVDITDNEPDSTQ